MADAAARSETEGEEGVESKEGVERKPSLHPLLS